MRGISMLMFLTECWSGTRFLGSVSWLPDQVFEKNSKWRIQAAVVVVFWGEDDWENRTVAKELERLVGMDNK